MFCGGGFEPKSRSVLWMPVDWVFMAGLFSKMVNASYVNSLWVSEQCRSIFVFPTSCSLVMILL